MANSRHLTMKKRTIVSGSTILILIIVWWILTSGTGIIKPLWFPTPESVIHTSIRMGSNLFYHAAATVLRVIASWLIGSALGVLTGLLIYRSEIIRSILNPIIEGLRPIPPVALIPLVLVWFGIGDSGKIFITALACFMIMVVNTFVACGNVPIVYMQAAQTMGVPQNLIYTRVFLPAIIPEIVSGARIAIASAFGIVVAVEYMGAKYGVGYLIMQASRTLNTAVVILGTIIIGVEAFLLEKILYSVSKYITRWKD